MKYLLAGTYLGLFAWQFAWHGLLPEPLGSRSWLLATLAAAPLAVPARGVLRAEPHGMIWGAFLLIFYFLVGVMEAWSNPAQRPAAMFQVLLVCSYFVAVVVISRRRPPPGA